MVMAGVPLVTVAAILGHRSLAMTHRYAHLSPSHMTAAVTVLDGAINGPANYTKTIQSPPADEKRGYPLPDNPLKRLVGHAGIEPATS